MISLSKTAHRLGKTFGTYALAAIMAALAVGLTVEPTLAEGRYEERRRYEHQENERHWREHQQRHYRQVAPPGYEYYAPPPPVYYYPPPLAPSLNIVIPFRIH